MLRYTLPILFTALLAFPASAQEVTVKKSDCRRLVKHSPSADVEYQPGVDVNGKKVAPADLKSGPQIKVPDEITIDLTVDLAARFGIPATANKFQGEANVGKVTIRGGKAYYNGQPLQDETQDALAQICREKYGL